MDIGIEAEIDLDELMGQIVRSVDPSRVIDSMLDHLFGHGSRHGSRHDNDEALCRRLISQINTRLNEEYPSDPPLTILIKPLPWPDDEEEEEEESP